MFKMVVSDIDGTLIYKGEHLNTVRFPIMLGRLDGLSVPFAAATGRHYRELKVIFGKNLLFPCVCCDGAYIMMQGEPIYSLPVCSQAIKHFFKLYDGTNITAIEFHSIDSTYLLGGTPIFRSKEERRLGRETVRRIRDFEEIDSEIYFVSVYGRSADAGLAAPTETRVSYSASGVVEFSNAKASKYTAVAELARRFGICEKDILFFGDGENDRELIENCELSYTTYCADRSVFSLTPHHTRDVIGTVIRLADESKNNRLHS